ncbi:MAG: site-specific integrase [Gammaproteobacteria bacterium]|nr:site-specific integrase [Gammaproteobacteria bacterium]
MATIVKAPSKAWKAVIRRKGWPTISKSFRTKRDAQDWARGTEDEMVRGVYLKRVPSESTTIDAALDRYLKEVTPTKRPSTQQGEKARAKRVKERLGRYTLASLSPDIAADFRDERRAEGKSDSTVRLELALLGHLYTVAIKEWGLGLAYNPVTSIRRPPPAAGRKRRLSGSEPRRMLKACNAHSNPMLGWVVRIALYSAMRQGEILSLTREQVDLNRRIVRLSETKNGSERTVPLARRAARVFAQALAHPIRPADTNLIFYGEPGRDGKRRPYRINKVWSNALSRAGITNLHFHDLRHEAISRLVERGLSDQEVAAISGHRSMQMLKRYTHLRAEDLVEKLDGRPKRRST